jgi:hypothetical protein
MEKQKTSMVAGKGLRVHYWGYLAEETMPYAAPLWLGEFGDAPDADPRWFKSLTQYIAQHDLDWAYWPLNAGPKAAHPASSETYTIIDKEWSAPLIDWRTTILSQIQEPQRGPGLDQLLCP